MSEFEAIREAITVPGAAGSLDPDGSQTLDGHTQETNCLNCGTALVGSYCHACGQHAHVHRTVGAFFHDLVHGVFHFEGKIWRTLPLLAWRPGELTRRYIDGQRASFVSPIALFLFSVFVMFAVVNWTGGGVIAQSRDKITGQLQSDQHKLNQLEAQRAALVNRAKPADGLDQQIDGLKVEMRALESAQKGNFITTDNASALPSWLRDGLKNVRRNPELVAYKLKSNAYKYSWAIIPLSVPFVWLLFPFNRRFKLYDHTVFVTYSLSFMTLLAALGGGSIAGPLVLIPPIHMYRHLQQSYGLTWASTLWRTLLLLTFAGMVIGIFASVLTALDLMQ